MVFYPMGSGYRYDQQRKGDARDEERGEENLPLRFDHFR